MDAAINGTLLANTPRTGTLSLTEGTATLATINISTTAPNSAGYYWLTVPAGLAAGSDTLKVSYSGDANYQSSSAITILTVLNDQMAVQYSTQALAGQAYTVNAAINGSLVGGAPRRLGPCRWSKVPTRWPASTWRLPRRTRVDTMP